MGNIKNIINRGNKYNLHSHTQFCDGRDVMENFVISAIESGFTDYGFSPHSPIPICSPCNMDMQDVSKYFEEFDRLKEKYRNQINLYKSFEIDFLDDWGPAHEFFQTMDLDYRIGSVHFIPSFAQDGYVDIDGNFENFKVKMHEHFYDDAEGVIISFFTQTLKMIENGGFDIIGHFDKIYMNASQFKSGVENEMWYKSLVKETVDAIMDYGYWVEINTKAFEKSKKFFPSVQFWFLLKHYNAPVLFNSDVHYPHLINSGRDIAIERFFKLP